MYSVRTPHERPTNVASDSVPISTLSLDQSDTSTNYNAPPSTKIHRLANAISTSRGHVETQIGSIEPPESSEQVATVNMFLDHEGFFQLKLGEGELKSLESSTGVSIENGEHSTGEGTSEQMALHKEYVAIQSLEPLS